MRILIAGGAGMLGHRLFLHLRPRHEVKVTLREDLAQYARFGLFDASNAYAGVDVRSPERFAAIAAEFRPEAIVNCVGIVKQISAAKESIPSIEVNALLPHRLAAIARSVGARLVHFSTDCVFSGRKGMYLETDPPDAEDLYGRSKLLGEVDDETSLTLRTSMIGHELARKTGLLEWFLAQAGPVRGFRRAIFSGFTTIELSRIVERVLVEYPSERGLWQVSSEPIDKYNLLKLIRKHYGLETGIEPDDALECDRSLDSERFRARFGYAPPSWDGMIGEMHKLRGLTS